MIVATAGHIDHGKTTLVKALTGVDTDRLPEEKKRGISIDLGFAYWHTPSGSIIGFVDVPGHERFIHNMLAGVCSIDFAMVVVAADDGVMPQTHEHLNIIDLMGVQRGVAVISKADRVDPARLREVEEEVRSLIDGSPLKGMPVLRFSAMSGMGLEAVRAALTDAASEVTLRATAGRRFRFAVDRAFTVVGRGTVVTGSVFDGMVKTGDRLLLSPSGQEVRVRAIQKSGSKADLAQAGERCALNLAGVELAQVGRGDWLLNAQLHAPTRKLDVEVRLLADEKRALRHWTPVHIHIGTKSVTGRIALRRSAAVEPGRMGFARLIPDQPIAALHGDRFILRDQSAQRTIGGGHVIDPFPLERRLPVALREQLQQAHALQEPDESLKALVACSPAGVDAVMFARSRNLDSEGFALLLKRSGLVAIGTGKEALVTTPAQAAIRSASKRETPAVENPEHLRLWQRTHTMMMAAGRVCFTSTDIAEAAFGKDAMVRDMLYRRAVLGDVVAIGLNRFYLREAMDQFIEIARNIAASEPDGRFTAARFRDSASVGRTLAIQILEAMDRLGATRRVADVRIVLDSPPSHDERLQ